MKNNTAREVLAETPPETRQFVRHYGELVLRIHEILTDRAWSQKILAEKMGKRPSEISKWLSGEHNFTLRSIAKLEVELGEDLIQIPARQKHQMD
jgi:transcriptional regulator with XRE-family HTH domain